VSQEAGEAVAGGMDSCVGSTTSYTQGACSLTRSGFGQVANITALHLSIPGLQLVLALPSHVLARSQPTCVMHVIDV
jgi:hypothetical protein